MNHQRVYDSIIQKAKSENRKKNGEVYYETHHILPRSMNGGDEENNLVLLTAKEHFVSHKLLLFIHPLNESMKHAFHMMCYSKNGDYIPSGKDFEYARILISNSLKESYQGENNPMYGKKHSKEAIQKIGLKSKGRRHSKKSKEKMALSKIGKNNPMYDQPGYFTGLTRSDKTKQKISESLKMVLKKECEYCHRFISPSNYNRHTDKCKLKNIS